MMGGLFFLRGGNMACGVTGGRLMVRLGKAGAAEALTAPEVEPLEIGGGRTADAFVTIDPAAIAEETALKGWVARGVAFADALPAKAQRRK
ncbi:TfoX N-terminal domain-containing protein [Paracoccus isoporae]|uniref:TfoX N-terminal domain-containing protein n=2 Tax=Paracoccus isoporae TaxID=591205 RepID=A0A1G6UW58_9RHOB|nr:TfoX N-terminal domain-containing protein [Paracoccus isoporae]